MKKVSVLIALLAGCTTQAPSIPTDTHPYQTLRTAYQEKDSTIATSAYADNAVVTYAYGDSPDVHTGSEAIDRSFEAFFSQFPAGEKIDLNFRMETSEQSGDIVHEQGFYRLRHSLGVLGYGRFVVERDMSEAGAGRFVADTSSDATLVEFEELPGPVMLDADDEQLDPAFYGPLAGRYKIGDDCQLVITQSIVRLFVRDTCTQQWRGLSRVSGREWTAGSTVQSDEVSVVYSFEKPTSDDAAPAYVEVEKDGHTYRAPRIDTYTRTNTLFPSEDGVNLAGDLYVPTGGATKGGMVVVHGSGPQDRNGYASIMAVLADTFAARGYAVLVYDKRGVGSSGGDWSTAGFATLAEDAAAAMRALHKATNISLSEIGLAGSSQAGWVVAKAIQNGANPDQVFLLGAAGSAMTVPEQNIYNTGVRMQCAGISQAGIDLALRQQRAFFDHVLTRNNAAELDSLTAEAQRLPEIADWIFPSSADIDFDAGEWFTTLELDFDPLQVWATYEGAAHFVFAEFDDSTPTAVALERLTSLSSSQAGSRTLTALQNAQHLGLEAGSLCDAELGGRKNFSPGLFSGIEGAAN